MAQVELVGGLAKYTGFKQMISGQCFCTILAVNIYNHGQPKHFISERSTANVGVERFRPGLSYV